MLASVDSTLKEAAARNNSAGGLNDWLTGIARSGIADKIPQLLASINREVDGMIEDLIAGCCVPIDSSKPLDFGRLHALDVLKLRNQILNSPELAELFDAEKNCYRGVWMNVISLLASTGTQPSSTTSDAGGASGNTPSPGVTTGA